MDGSSIVTRPAGGVTRAADFGEGGYSTTLFTAGEAGYRVIGVCLRRLRLAPSREWLELELA